MKVRKLKQLKKEYSELINEKLTALFLDFADIIKILKWFNLTDILSLKYIIFGILNASCMPGIMGII